MLCYTVTADTYCSCPKYDCSLVTWGLVNRKVYWCVVFQLYFELWCRLNCSYSLCVFKWYQSGVGSTKLASMFLPWKNVESMIYCSSLWGLSSKKPDMVILSLVQGYNIIICFCMFGCWVYCYDSTAEHYLKIEMVETKRKQHVYSWYFCQKQTGHMQLKRKYSLGDTPPPKHTHTTNLGDASGGGGWVF